MLGDLEQLVLLAVLRTGDDAYGVRIAEMLAQSANRKLTLATIHKALERLEAKGFVASHLGDPTPVRGGRAKRYFRVTGEGRRVLRKELSVIRSMAAGLSLGWDNG
jgi:DNA-binding PadR family transcriptional regulator